MREFYNNCEKLNNMRKKFLVVFAFYLVTACNNPANSKINNKESTSAGDSVKATTGEPKMDSISNAIPDFLLLAKAKNTTAYQGFLQGVEKNDSSGPYYFKEYYGDTLSFQLVYFPKTFDKRLVNYDSIRKAEANNYSDYICFAFVYPMKDPDKMKDHSDNVTYPVTVTSYVRKNGEWKLLSGSKAGNLTELSKYQTRCIYSVIK